MRWNEFRDDGRLDAGAAQVLSEEKRSRQTDVKLLYWYFRSVYGAKNDDMAMRLSRFERGIWIDYIVYIPLV